MSLSAGGGGEKMNDTGVIQKIFIAQSTIGRTDPRAQIQKF